MVGTKTTVDVELAVTVAGESVDVIAGGEGIQVNTENQTLQTVVSESEIRELPTIDRNPYDLVQLSGNVSPFNPSGRGAGFAINGQRSASTNIPLDAVQEFSVLTSNFSAEFGRASGGIVNVATKAGTSEFHGTIYEFNRLSRLLSRGFALNGYHIKSG